MIFQIREELALSRPVSVNVHDSEFLFPSHVSFFKSFSQLLTGLSGLRGRSICAPDFALLIFIFENSLCIICRVFFHYLPFSLRSSMRTFAFRTKPNCIRSSMSCLLYNLCNPIFSFTSRIVSLASNRARLTPPSETSLRYATSPFIFAYSPRIGANVISTASITSFFNSA